MFATHEGDGLSFIDRPDRYRRIRDGERKNAIIVGNRGCWTKRALGLRVQLVGVPYLRQRTNDHLRGQSKHFAHVFVAQLLKLELSKDARIPCHLTDIVTGSIRRLKRSPECIRLRGGRKEFQLYCKFHYSDIVAWIEPESDAALESECAIAPRFVSSSGLKTRGFQLRSHGDLNEDSGMEQRISDSQERYKITVVSH